MGRILRVGTDTTVNYTFLQTSGYDSAAPAATQSAWPNTAAMDQAFDEPTPLEVDAEGVLITFARFPYAFEGAMVKIRPTYDTSGGEDPFFELWTHDSSTLAWTLRRRIELSNLFVGVETGQRKVIDFTFFPFLSNVDKVWVTQTSSTGAPQMRFIAVHLFGQCEQTVVIPNPPYPGGGENPCVLHPDGRDADGNPCLVPGADCSQYPEYCRTVPDVDMCNPSSVEAYEEALRDIPGALDQFQTWYNANATLIAQTCAGAGGPGGHPPTPPLPPLPPLPALDLCDDTSIDAFRAAVAGDADQLAAFDDFIDGLDEAGYFDLTCPADDPPEQYVDPVTGEPAADPIGDDTTPFASGPGGVPQPGTAEPPPAEDDGGGGSDSGSVIERTQRYILVWSGNDLVAAQALVDAQVTPLPAPTNFESHSTDAVNYGPALGVSTVGLGFTPAPHSLVIRLRKLPFSCYASVRCQVLRLRGTPDLRYSISDVGIDTLAAQAGCPAGPDWIITPDAHLAPAATSIVGNRYFEYVFNGAGLSNTALITLALPRATATQNDAASCDPDFQPRSRLGFQRSGCLNGFVAKLRARWLHDVSAADYDGSSVFDYIHVRPYIIVLDVRLDAVVLGKGADLRRSSIALTTLTDAQPVETC